MPLPGTASLKAPAARLSLAALRQLGRLTATGKLYGQWRQQLAPPSAGFQPA
jgi:hypothetical protein